MQRNEDRWQRIIVERPPPATWRAICAWALACGVGIGLGLAEPSGAWDMLALALFILGGLQVLRGLAHVLWARLAGADGPVIGSLRRRLRR